MQATTKSHFSRLFTKPVLSPKRSPWLAVCLAVLSFGAMLPFGSLDFDGHHDGVMVSAALAVSSGKNLFLDVFLQYGPLTSWLQGLFLQVWPGGPALGVRVLSLLQIATVVFLLADLGRIAPTSWRLGPGITFPAIILWVASWDGFLGVSPLPWSSLTALTLVSLGAYIFAALTSAAFSAIASRHLTFILGLIIGILPFARQSSGMIALLVALIWISGIASPLRDRSSGRVDGGKLFMGLGILLGFVSVVAFLLVSGSLAAWWEQSVIWPVEWLEERDSWAWKFVERFLPWTGGAAILAVIIPLTYQTKYRLFRHSGPVGLYLYSILLGGATVSGFGADSIFLRESYQNWVTFIPSVGYSAISFYLFCGGTIAGYYILHGIFSIYRGREIDTGAMALSLFSLPMLSQAVPVMDTRHFWWALPFLLLLGTRFFLEQTSTLGSKTGYAVRVLATPLVVSISLAGVVGVANKFLVARVQFPDNTIAEGLSGRPEAVETFVGHLRLVNQMTDDPNYFIVHDGHLASITGVYRSESRYFVMWGPGKTQIDDLKLPANVLVDTTRYEAIFNRLTENSTSEIYEIEKNQGLTLYRVENAREIRDHNTPN